MSAGIRLQIEHKTTGNDAGFRVTLDIESLDYASHEPSRKLIQEAFERITDAVRGYFTTLVRP